MLFSKSVNLVFRGVKAEEESICICFDDRRVASKFRKLARSRLMFAKVEMCKVTEPTISIEKGMEYPESIRRQINALLFSEKTTRDLYNFFLSSVMVDFLEDNEIIGKRTAIKLKEKIAAKKGVKAVAY